MFRGRKKRKGKTEYKDGKDSINWPEKQPKPRKYQLVLLLSFGENRDIKKESWTGNWSISEQNREGT